jgi:predicted DCC family thiol-disulfide oxidoreductase YuxK
VERWKKKTGDHVAYIALQEAPMDLGIPRSELEHAVHFVEQERVSRGAEAVFRLLSYSGSRWLLRFYEKLPGFAPVSEWSYDFIARHRGRESCTVPRR